MNAQSILTVLDKQPVVYHKSSDFERYVLLRKDSLALVLYGYREGNLKELDNSVLWADNNQLVTWVAPEAPVFAPDIVKNFQPFLSAWIQLYQQRKWNEHAPLLAEVVRAVHTYCMGASYQVFLVKEGLPLNQAEPWEVDISRIEEIYNYDA